MANIVHFIVQRQECAILPILFFLALLTYLPLNYIEV